MKTLRHEKSNGECSRYLVSIPFGTLALVRTLTSGPVERRDLKCRRLGDVFLHVTVDA